MNRLPTVLVKPINNHSKTAPFFNHNIKLLIIAIWGILLVFPSINLYADDELTMGVFPRRNATVSYQMFSPLASYLSQKLGQKVNLSLSKNFKDFWQGVKQQKFDLVHYNQLHYIKSHKSHGYEVILRNEEFGKSTIAGVILVHNNSTVNSLSQLKGKKIIFGGGPAAMISSVVPRFMLLEQGLEEQDYHIIYAKNPPNAVVALAAREAEAAGAGDRVLEMKVVSNVIDTNKLKILAKSKELAHLPWAVKGDMPQKLRQRIQTIMHSLSETEQGKQILKTARLTGLVITEDKDYDPHRAIVQSVLSEAY